MTSTTQTPPAPPAPEGNKSLKRLRNYSVANMVYSLLAVFVLVFAWWALMPNPQELDRRAVEVPPVSRYAALESAEPVWTPEAALGQEWSANFVTYGRFAGEPSWRIGVVTPQEEYVELSQTADATTDWTKALTAKAGEQVGTRTITGPDGAQEWTAFDGQERALILEPGPGREETTIVRGTADWAEMEEFIGLLEVADAQ